MAHVIVYVLQVLSIKRLMLIRRLNKIPVNENELTIDGKTMEFEDGDTILQVAKRAGIYIPTLCYIEGLSPYGACRLCIVKVEGMKDYPPSCSTPAAKNMKIITKDEELQYLRREVLKLILSEHPNPCLICDNNDICEDIRITKSKAGRSFGCFTCPNQESCKLKKVFDYLEIDELSYELEYKNYPLKRNDPFLEIDYNLCILCGKCVRICNELRGIGAINFINRGHNTRISTALDMDHLDTNCQFCGACIDVCPTGALSSKNTKWAETTDNYINSTCTFCSVGCSFNYYYQDEKLIESIPNSKNEVNNGQGCIIGRFCTVPFINSEDRIKDPLIKKNGNLIPCEWDEVYDFISNNLRKYKPEEIGILLSSDLSYESSYIFSKLEKEILHTNNISIINDDAFITAYYNVLKNRLSMTLPFSSFNHISNSEIIMIINSNIQSTHPVLMINLKKAHDNGAKIVSLNFNGSSLPFETERLVDYKWNLTKYELISLFLKIVNYLMKKKGVNLTGVGNLNQFKSLNQTIKTPDDKFQALFELFDELSDMITIILGNYHKLDRIFAEDLIGTFLNLNLILKDKMNFIPLWRKGNIEGVYDNIFDIYKYRSQIIKDIEEGKIRALYTTERINNTELLKNLDFLIIQDIFISDDFQFANVILPSCTFIEDSGTIMNSERRPQKFNKVIPHIGNSKPDWLIGCELAKKIDKNNRDKFNFTKVEEISKEIEEIKQKNIRDIKDLNEFGLYIPSSKVKYDNNRKGDFTLESFKYRSEKISNQVKDLRELIQYRNLGGTRKKSIRKEPQKKTEFEVIYIKEVVPNIYQMIIKAPLIAKKAKPGNFIIIMRDEYSERIPMTLSDWDSKNGIIKIYFEERGYSTKELTRLEKGDYLYSIVGPLGNEIEIKKFGTMLIGGGCYGIGAIYPIAKQAKIMNNKVIVILEARNEQLLYLENEFDNLVDEVIYCTSDGSRGLKGKIKTAIEQVIEKQNEIDVCFFIGCKYMMMEAAQTTKKHKIPTYASLNTIMIDGTGMCGGCRLSIIKDGKKISKFACVDGPTFNAHHIDWGELLERSTLFKIPEILVFQNHCCKAIEKIKSDE
ncbi:MAG: sulfide/dihydroorotate dehydrogenase-like FAD/NAD-binding protein [Candidatus Lokiarchaeota archaeon]|nr:sulfide/dihydroorotate dehydrogenase-like FAD/NAD-binding protein [Candidatus Lokiarchaeota archaeon]